MNLDLSFRGTDAVAAGALTRGQLFGPRFRRLMPDVYVAAGTEMDFAMWSRAAAVFAAPGGVLSGYSAAVLLGASCEPEGAPAEVTVGPHRHPRCPPRLLVHRDRLAEDEVMLMDGMLLTSPVRTAFDLARRVELREGVVAVDALSHRHPFGPDDLRVMRSTHLGARGNRALEPVLRLTDRRVESPMESRIRVALHVGGLPPPEVQHPVPVAGRRFRLDLAYPGVLLGIEYDGREHLDPEQALRDLEREALLAAHGWKILRFRAGTVLHRPGLVAAAARAELLRRAR